MKVETIAPTPPAPALQLINLLKQCSSWNEVERAITSTPAHKTEAWHLLSAEEKARIKALKQRATEVPVIEVGSQVRWLNCPGCLEFLSPFTVRAVEGEMVWLDWIAHPVLLSKLILEQSL